MVFVAAVLVCASFNHQGSSIVIQQLVVGDPHTNTPQTQTQKQHTSHQDGEHEIPPDSPQFWVYLGISVGLVVIAGVMSGLTIGMSSLDALKLKLLQMNRDSSEKEKKQVARVTPVLDNHHLLLCTLLIINSAAMEALPIFLDALVPSYIAIILSVTVVLIFGEIIPQAVCTKSPLAIGATFAPFVRCLMILVYPIAWPISKLLDCAVGDEESSSVLFKKSELNTLFDLYQKGDDDSGLQHDVVKMLHGAHSFQTLMVKDVNFTKANKIFTLSESETLTPKVVARIRECGHSRIPVYRKTASNVVGVLLAKKLIGRAFGEDDTVSRLSHETDKENALVAPYFVTPNTLLREVLNEFQEGKCHLALVTNEAQMAKDNQTNLAYDPSLDPAPVRLLGLITLEEIIEVLIGEPIWDEFDALTTKQKQMRTSMANNPSNGNPWALPPPSPRASVDGSFRSSRAGSMCSDDSGANWQDSYQKGFRTLAATDEEKSLAE